MAVLSTTIRQQLWRGLMRYWSAQREAIAVLTKADLQAAVNAADDWADANAAAYNLTLPVAARTNLTAAQKALLLALVILARWDAPRIRNIVGEVD